MDGQANEQGRRPGENESSVSLAASSMINASDMITAEAYDANLKKIQEVKEMVRRLEMNNEAAHKNFLIDQLEKRAKEGRHAEDMLARLRSQAGLSETVQFTNNATGGRSDVVLPTTATLVEVPEPHSSRSYSSPVAATTVNPPQTTQQSRSVNSQPGLLPQPQPQLYPSSSSQYYVPSHPTRHYPQNSATPQAPVDAAQTTWYTRQNAPGSLPYETGFQPIQLQQPQQSWSRYSPQIIVPPQMDNIPGYQAFPAGQVRTVPVHSSSRTGSYPNHHEPEFSTQSTAVRPTATTHSQPRNLPSSVPTSQVKIPFQGGSAGQVKTHSGQPSSIRSYPDSSESQSVRQAVSTPITISELQRPHKPPQQSQQHQIRAQHPSLQPQMQPQLLVQSIQQHHSQAKPPTQRPLHPPQMHLQVPQQPIDAARHPNTSVSQQQTLPSQPTAQDKAQHSQPRMDQAKFLQLFRNAIQLDVLQFKAFWFQAKAIGISDEWFSAAINSLPRDVWQSVMARLNQSWSAVTAPPQASALQQQSSPAPNPGVPIVTAKPPTSTPLVYSTSPAQQATKPSTSVEREIVYPPSEETSISYAAELQYYSGQATKSARSVQVASAPAVLPQNNFVTETIHATPKQDMLLSQANVRTPRDADKSTLARDILRSLGKTIPKAAGGEPMDKAENRGCDQPPDTTSQLVFRVAPPKLPVVPPTTTPVDAGAHSIPLAKPSVQDGLQASTTSPVLKEAATIEGPIMIDLTLEDLDEPVGEEQKPTFPTDIPASADTSFQVVSSTNTTSHTPLLESLSLEESPVDAATSDHGADMCMHSLPSTFIAKKNVESEFLLPTSGSEEPISTGPEPEANEASDHLLGKLPLFLPSPPISPTHTEPPETDLRNASDERESRASIKRRSTDVGVMEVDTEVAIPPHARKRRKQQVYVLIPPAPLYVKEARAKKHAMEEGIVSDLDGSGEDEETQYSHLEQLLIEESKSQLLERRCQWLNCDAILNCASNLFAHLKNHAREGELQAPFVCRWARCQRRFDVERERDIHFERHTTRPLACPFADCDEQFDKPVEVMQHEVQHQKVEHREPLVRKPTWQPIVPAIPARLGAPPDRLPSHRMIPRRVVKCRISAERHAIVGPWILWNIFSPVDLSTRKQYGSMRSRQTNEHEGDGADARHDDYDFLGALSCHSAKNAEELDDLDSTLVTMSVARGLTLWGERGPVADAGWGAVA